jgi:hypothetical protein
MPGAGAGNTTGSGTMTTTPGGRLQLIVGLPELEVVAEDPGPAPPLETGTDDEDPPVMVPEPVPLPEPTFGLEPEPAHPVFVATTCPPRPGGLTGTTSVAPPPSTKKGPKGDSSSTSSVTPPTSPRGSKSPKVTVDRSSVGCCWNSGAAGSVAPKPKNGAAGSVAPTPRNASKGSLPGCG